MSLQFIMGPSGSGKSHYLYDWVTKESLKNTDRKYLVLVPEQFTMQTQKDLVMASPRKGILNVEVLSFNRLAQRVLDETGENNRIILSDIGKSLVIRKVASECKDDLKVLGGNLRKIGYISKVKSIISEFTQYNLQSENLGALIEETRNYPSLHYKLSDIQKVYEKFQAYLEGKYITAEEILDVLADVADQSELLKDSVVVLDGFTGFTPIQLKLLRKLLTVCDEVIVTVTMDQREEPFRYEHPYQLFSLSKEMVTKLMKISEECKVEVNTPIYLYKQPIYRFKENKPLAFLENQIFRYSQAVYEQQQENIQIWRAKNAREEVDFVAQKIRNLVREKGYRYRDIAVFTNDITAYANYIEQVFAKYDLPIFMDHKRSILVNSFVEYLRSLLALAEQHFSYESVFRYLRTGFTCISMEEIDLLENYVIALGIKGFSKWKEKWIRRTKNMEEAELEIINQIRERFVENVEPLMIVLSSKRKTVLDVTRALHDSFVKEEIQKQVQEYQAYFEAEGELALAKEYAQIYKIVIDLLDQFVELLGDEAITIKEYCELLDAGLEEAKVGIIPPSIDQIVIGDVERSRVKDVKAVFLIGVNDIYIPGKESSTSLLSEYDREIIHKCGSDLAPNAKEKTYIQKFYLYLLLTKPTEQVYLSFSEMGSDGKGIRPSYLIAELQRRYSQLNVFDVDVHMKDRELTPKSGIAGVVEGLQNIEREITEEWKELYVWYRSQPEWSEKVDKLLEAAFYEKPESMLTRETARKLYGEILTNNVSRLEQFSRCAYAHFLKYGIKLKEREQYQFQSLDWGLLFHGVIERFSRKLERSQFTWTDIPRQDQEALIKESVEECVTDYGNSILYSTKRNEYVIERLKRMAMRTVWVFQKQLEKGDFKPEGYELFFEEEIKLGEDEKLRLNGVIDRVDICETEEKDYVKIIDYKTGNTVFDLSKLTYGLQMQLVVYLNAAMAKQKKKHPDKEIVPAGLLYYSLQDPFVEDKKDPDKIEEAILKALCPNGMIHDNKEVFMHLEHDFKTKSNIIPVSVKKDGTVSNVLSKDEFELLSDYVEEKVQAIGKQILAGDTDVFPYRLEGKTGCDYCEFNGICGFEKKIPGYKYRDLDALDDAQALQKMQEEVDS